MRKPLVARAGVLFTALLLLFGGAAFARSYSTAFPGSEAPLSEAGNWTGGKTTGLDWADVATTPGFAFGMQTGSGGYDDSTALLSGRWGPDQSVTATVHTVNQTGGKVYEEVEIRLRSTIAPHSNIGYEINFRCLRNSSSYVQIVRWNGPLGDFTYLADEKGVQKGIKDGDVLRATVKGNVIIAYINGVKVAQAADSTFAGGSPGIGFFIQGAAGVNRDFGFTRITASDEADPPPSPSP
jgi:hypothetical protein